MKMGLAIVVCAVVIGSGALVALRFMGPLPPILQGYVDVLVINESTNRHLTLDRLVQMNPTSGNARFQNQNGNWGGYGTYEGVRLSTIIETVGTMSAYDTVNVTAADGYKQSYSHDNLYPNATFHALQGDLILAYAVNGTAPPTWLEGPRIVFLPPDGNYSVSDAQQTTPPAWFRSSGGARWVRNVTTIELLHNHTLEGSVNVQVIDGSTKVNLTLPQLLQMNHTQGKSQFESKTGWKGYGTYEGVRLSTIIETVGSMGADDAVRVNTTDGWSALYSYYNLYPNATFYALQGDLILAYAYEGNAPPTWPDGPRIVFLPPDEQYGNDDANKTTPGAWFPPGSYASNRWLKWVATIELVHGANPPAYAARSSPNDEDGNLPNGIYRPASVESALTIDAPKCKLLCSMPACSSPIGINVIERQWRECC